MIFNKMNTIFVSVLSACFIVFSICYLNTAEADDSADSGYTGYYPVAKDKGIIHLSHKVTLQDLENDLENLMRKMTSFAFDYYALSFSEHTKLNPPTSILAEQYRAIKDKILGLKTTHPQFWKDDKKLKKPIIPILFLSKIIGDCEGSKPIWEGIKIDEDNPDHQAQYADQIQRLKAVDCFAIWRDDTHNRRFLTELEGALWLAKKTGAPGIIIENEAYVNYRAVNFRRLADHVRKSSSRNDEEAKAYILQRLKAFAEKIGMRIDSIFPKANIYFLFIPFHTLESKKGFTGFDEDANITAILAHYLIQYAHENHSRFKVLEGGEQNIWYPQYSTTYTEDRLDNQVEMVDPYLDHFLDNFEMAGCMSFWSDFKNDYKEGDGFVDNIPELYGEDVDTIPNNYLSDLDDSFYLLIKNRDYVWIWPKYGGRHFIDVYEKCKDFRSFCKEDNDNYLKHRERIKRFTYRVSDLIRSVKILYRSEL